MSSLSRAIHDAVLFVDLEEERSATMTGDRFIRDGRTARTLVKNDSMRIVLVCLDAGGELTEHSAPGPISIHAIAGCVEVRLGDASKTLGPGQLLAVAAELRHAVRSEEGATFLLTVSGPGR